MQVNLETGLTLEENKCMDALIEAYEIYNNLPKDHPHEIFEFVSSIHRLQDLLAVRVARRIYPIGWGVPSERQLSPEELEIEFDKIFS